MSVTFQAISGTQTIADPLAGLARHLNEPDAYEQSGLDIEAFSSHCWFTRRTSVPPNCLGSRMHFKAEGAMGDFLLTISLRYQFVSML